MERPYDRDSRKNDMERLHSRDDWNDSMERLHDRDRRNNNIENTHKRELPKELHEKGQQIQLQIIETQTWE